MFDEATVLTKKKIVITGAAGLVGQNLVPLLKAQGHTDIVAIDKHPANTSILRKLHPDIKVILADLADSASVGLWSADLINCDALISGHAQIGGNSLAIYLRNNQEATERLMDIAVKHKVPYVVNISSAAVMSAVVNNDYSDTKRAQELLVKATGIKQVVLRPSIMFGWFDRKHLGWLAAFMRKVPVFPIPGDGRYMRQPLYVKDLCSIISASIEHEITGEYNITGQDKIDYIDLVRAMKQATRSRTVIFHIPYGIFAALVRIYERCSSNPVFTVKQLELLVTPDIFEVIDWPFIFGVSSTPLLEALNTTYGDPVYSKIALEF